MTATWTITRAQLIDAIASITVRGTLLPGRADAVVTADDMADAILEQLPALGADALAAERARLREPIAVLAAWLERLPQRHVPLRAAEALQRLRDLTAPGEDG